MFQKSLSAFLVLVVIGLAIYPLWGVLAPESYAIAELKHHYALDANTSNAQVVAASLWLYLSNFILVVAVATFAWYLVHPKQFKWALVGGIALIVFPLFRIASRILMDLQLTSHLASSNFAVSFSTEELLISLVGLILLGVAYVHRPAI